MGIISQWAVYQMCKSLGNNYSYILKILKDIYPELYSESPTYDWERKSILGCFHKNFTELLKELNEEDLKKEKEKSFQWSHWKESNKKEIPIIDLTHHPLTEDSCRNTPTNWDIYQLCKRKKYRYKNIVKLLKKNHSDLYIPANLKDPQLQSRVHMIFRKINIFLKNKQFNEIAKEKRNLFTWCNENSPCNNKKTTRFSSDVDLNERTPSIINEDCCEGATGIAPVDNQNVSTLLSNNCLTSLLDSNLQTSPLLPIKSLQTTATGASPSPPKENQPGISKESESQNLILSIKKFESLVKKAIAEIALKDARINCLKKEINNVMKNQKKISSNLKRLKFRHLHQKIST